jgi:hypothetical protein
MLLVLGVADRAVMDVMGWSKIDMAQRYMHVPDDLRQRIASQVGGLLGGRRPTTRGPHQALSYPPRPKGLEPLTFSDPKITTGSTVAQRSGPGS